MYINTKELAKRTGATFRQIDYWCLKGVISPVGKSSPGSGIKREFDESIISRVRLLAKLSKAFHNSLHKNEQKKICEAYDKGYIDVGGGIILSWPDEKNSDTERVRTHNDILDLFGDE
jgi:DNA-binding transcriptional MerR regulator